MPIATTDRDVRGRDDTALNLARLGGFIDLVAGSAGDAIFAFRNTHSTNNILVSVIGFRPHFIGTNSTTTFQYYQFFRFTGASMTAGTALTAAQLDNGGTPPPSYDARIGTGLAALGVTGVVFEANAFYTAVMPRIDSVPPGIDNILGYGVLLLRPGEGFAVKMQQAVASHDAFSINVSFCYDIAR